MEKHLPLIPVEASEFKSYLYCYFDEDIVNSHYKIFLDECNRLLINPAPNTVKFLFGAYCTKNGIEPSYEEEVVTQEA